MSLDDNQVLGIAMGTSQAAGYVNAKGNITGWLNELSFVPVDHNPQAPIDEWSGDYGVGVNYFSQDAVIRLAKQANIHLDEGLSPAEKLKIVQRLAEEKNDMALEIFKTIGVYLGYSIAYYARFYDISHILILGRVTSGIGGVLILENAQKVLNESFAELAEKIHVTLPDEKSRRVGQSIAAASLPKI
jgi:predicted NBD/HSP70 family sugar kinase